MSTVAVRLIIEDLEGSTTVVNLGTEDVTIGRKPHNTIQLTEQNVSRSHAKLSFRDDGWLIQDLGSYNGVKVNGVPISTPTLLRESDLIQIGDYHLTLTDDVDRATVDIERPRYAANDPYAAGAHVGMMSSSNDLPSVSVEDLNTGRQPQPMGGYAAPTHQPEKSSKAGLVIGIIGVTAAVIGIAAFLAVANSKDDDDGKAGEKAAVKSETPPTPPPPSTTTGAPPPTTTGAEPVPEVPSTTTAAPNDSGDAGADGGEIVDETTSGGEEVVPEVEPAPTPEPTDKPKPKQQSKPKLPPDEALAEARKASLSGNNAKAYSLAKDAYDQNHSGDALNLMGVAACKMGSASKAKSAHKKMTAKDKAMLEKLCGSLGIEL